MTVDLGPVSLDAGGADVRVLASSDDANVLRVTGTAPLTLRWRGPAGEHLVGLGERFVRLEQTGQRWTAAIVDLLAAEPDDTYYYVPLLFSSGGYAVLLDTHARCTWDLTGADRWQVTVPEDQVEVHVLRGAPRRLVQLATQVHGRVPAPPPWMLGVWKTTLGGTERVLREAQRLAEHDIPVTACWVYDHYHEATNTGCGGAGTYPSGEYPSLSALTRGLHDLGYRALGYVQPCLYEGSQPYQHAAAKGWTVRWSDGSPAVIPFFNPLRYPGQLELFDDGGAYVDLTDPDAAGWYAGLLEQTLDQGWDGWMQDMGEHLPDDAVLADGTTGAESRNRYPLLYHRLAHRVWSARPDAGVFVRSGALGVNPYVPVVWPGDQHADWSADRGLRSVLPAGPSLGLTGVGVFGPDINGIVDGVDGGEAGRDEELWIRWCQFGAMHPVMRDHLGFKHGAGTPVDAWSTPRTTRVFRDYARLHLQLAPYLYDLALEAHRTGVGSVRPLLLEHPEHDEAWTTDDQYLLGDALLVAPVHVKGARSRSVWFPPGEWVSWWDDGARYEGPAHHEVPAPLERIPLFQRAGTSIPMLREPDADLSDLAGRPVEHRTA